MSNPGKKTCLVLGGTGFIGSAIVREARERGYEASAVGRTEYEAHKGANCDLLINANGNSRKYIANRDPELDYEMSVQSVDNSFEDFDAGRYVYLSSVDVYTDRAHPAHNAETEPLEAESLPIYGAHKMQAERIVQAKAPKWLIFRMGGFVGAGLKKNAIYDLLKGAEIRFDPDSKYQFIDSAALAQIVFDLVEKEMDGEIFNICASGTVSLREVAEWIPGRDLTGLPDDLPKDHCEVNLDKLAKIHTIPGTRETVRQFVQDVLAGRVLLG